MQLQLIVFTRQKGILVDFTAQVNFKDLSI